jgi:hypothetical protein
VPLGRIEYVDKKPARRWFAFRLRTLFIVVVPACAALAWWVSYSREWIRERHVEISSVRVGFNFARPPAIAPGGLWILGESAFGRIEWYGRAGDIERIKKLFPEANVVMVSPPQRQSGQP